MLHTNEDGTEIEVFTADEVKARETAAIDTAVKAKEAEFGKTKAELDSELAEVKKALGDRAGEFKQFRRLNDETVAKLTVAERTIYENGVKLQEAHDARTAAEKKALDTQVDSALRAKAGKDDKLFTKMKETWSIIGVNALTPEEIEKKTMMVLGAIQTTEPDLLANVAGFSGSGWAPPKAQSTTDGTSFADTDKGRSIAKDLGLIMEPPKK